jgi:hypothetical protein
MRYLVAFLVVLIAAVAAGQPGASAQDGAGGPSTTPNLRVAFIGDMGINSNAVSVLQLIEDEGADMAIAMGDLGYGNETNPQTAINWHNQVTNVLGADYPFFATIGNHDVGNWTTYSQLLEDRLALLPEANCTGSYGSMMTCTYEGLYFILSGTGTQPNSQDHQPHIDYLEQQLAADNSIWRICAWHKNQQAAQIGGKTNEVGWGSYEACRERRAIIATAHEHSYQRTKTLTNTVNQTVDPLWPDPDTLRVTEGATFLFVSGLGGNSIRDQERCFPSTPPYGCNGEWASIYSSNQSADYGALFIDFNVDGDPYKAEGYFKDVEGNVIDTFTVFSEPTPVGGVAELSPDEEQRLIEEASESSSNTLVFIALGAFALLVLVAITALGWRLARSRAA